MKSKSSNEKMFVTESSSYTKFPIKNSWSSRDTTSTSYSRVSSKDTFEGGLGSSNNIAVSSRSLNSGAGDTNLSTSYHLATILR